ncbi:MAG: hypothetical protein ACI37Q_00485 [Candidatus Gastranaerophilaceae bacterium]
MENAEREVQFKDAAKHYFSSLLIYGTILAFISFCPVYNSTIGNESFDYITFFVLYYLLYVIIAPFIFFILKPKSLLQSKSVAVIEYFRRQVKRTNSTEEFLNNIEPNEFEKQAFMSFFIKGFFGVSSVILLCSNYLPSFGYNIDFLKVMFQQAQQYMTTGDTGGGIIQYIIDTGDMWLKLIFTFTLIIYSISYLTELNIFKNKIKSADTTPLGVFSCIICYYPIIIFTNQVLNLTEQSLLPVDNQNMLTALYIIAIAANLFSLIAIIRLGTKAGNLTNRGIVTGFPYNIIRHPDYSMQICYIITTSIPLFILPTEETGSKFFIILGILAWVYIYYLRAVTEERHLIKDEEYKKYVEKVKYRFIPKVI